MLMQQLVNGVMIGSVYALTAMGATLIYGILHILDIANAAAYAVGAYLGWYVYSLTNNLVLAFLISMVLTGLLGVVVEKYIYYPIISKPNVIPIVPLITSVGLFTLTGDLIRLILGPNVKEFGFNFKIGIIEIGKITINPEWVFIIILTAVLFSVLWFVLNKTKLGLAWRATAEDTEMSKAVGVNTHMSMALSYILGYGFAAAAGIMVGMLYNSIFPTMGDIPSYKMLAIIVLGGLGNPVGTVVAGLVIGLAETLSAAYIGSVMPRDAIAFIVLILVLLVKPSGLISKKNA
ncbi:MAG: branched-chain amino acid ABC transporter permease [Sedimentibacter sp.]